MSIFNHILLSPGYAPGIIAVNITWIEREFNACQTHRSMYTSIFNRLRAIVRYWSEIATFSYHLAFNAPYGVAPGTIAVNVTRLERGFNACKTPRCIYPYIFNRFPVIQAGSLKVHHFSTFWPPVYAPETIAVNVTWIEREINACQTPRSMYPTIFNRFWDIASYWSKIATFSYPTYV